MRFFRVVFCLPIHQNTLFQRTLTAPKCNVFFLLIELLIENYKFRFVQLKEKIQIKSDDDDAPEKSGQVMPLEREISRNGFLQSVRPRPDDSGRTGVWRLILVSMAYADNWERYSFFCFFPVFR